MRSFRARTQNGNTVQLLRMDYILKDSVTMKGKDCAISCRYEDSSNGIGHFIFTKDVYNKIERVNRDYYYAEFEADRQYDFWYDNNGTTVKRTMGAREFDRLYSEARAKYRAGEFVKRNRNAEQNVQAEAVEVAQNQNQNENEEEYLPF